MDTKRGRYHGLESVAVVLCQLANLKDLEAVRSGARSDFISVLERAAQAFSAVNDH